MIVIFEEEKVQNINSKQQNKTHDKKVTDIKINKSNNNSKMGFRSIKDHLDH